MQIGSEGAAVRVVEVVDEQVTGVSELHFPPAPPRGHSRMDMDAIRERETAREAVVCAGIPSSLPAQPFPSGTQQVAGDHAIADAADTTDAPAATAFPTRGYWTDGSGDVDPRGAVRRFGTALGADLSPTTFTARTAIVEAYLPTGTLVEVHLFHDRRSAWTVDDVRTVDACGSTGSSSSSAPGSIPHVGFPVVAGAQTGRLWYLAGGEPTKVVTVPAGSIRAQSFPLRHPDPLRRWLLVERDANSRVVAITSLVP